MRSGTAGIPPPRPNRENFSWKPKDQPSVGMFRPGRGRVLVRPARRDDLGAGVELDALHAVHVQVAEERILPAAERVERHRHRDRHVDADHADLDLVLEAARGAARLGEDRRAVGVGIGIYQRDRLFQSCRRATRPEPGRRSRSCRSPCPASRCRTAWCRGRSLPCTAGVAAVEHQLCAFSAIPLFDESRRPCRDARAVTSGPMSTPSLSPGPIFIACAFFFSKRNQADPRRCPPPPRR